jgi:hypothetical protein
MHIKHHITVFLIQIQIYNMHTLKTYVFFLLNCWSENVDFSKNMRLILWDGWSIS